MSCRIFHNSHLITELKIRHLHSLINIVDSGSVANFGADSGLCLSYVRILGPKRNLDYRSFFSLAFIQMISFIEQSSFELRCDTVIERLELYCVIVIKHACCLLYYLRKINNAIQIYQFMFEPRCKQFLHLGWLKHGSLDWWCALKIIHPIMLLSFWQSELPL